MSIFVTEPGRPLGTRLPEVFRNRRVGDVSELAESHPVTPGESEATDAEFQQAARSGRHRALQEYGTAAAGERREQRPYLPGVANLRPGSAQRHRRQHRVGGPGDHGSARVHHLLVKAEEQVAGLIDQRWLLTWLHQQGPEAMAQQLVHIELPAFLTASPETDAHQVARLMLAHQLNAALVVNEGGQPQGIVTSTDYLRLYASAGQQEGSV